VRDDVRHVYHLYVVRVAERPRVMEYLGQQGIGAGIHYPIPLPVQPAYPEYNDQQAAFPVTCDMMDEILSLPIHGSMSDAQVDHVITQLTKIVGELA
jgi:dTDP-4-amino-4,6-dideoxygalactose transaminase